MIKSLSKSAGISLALVMAFFAQGVIPFGEAYANSHAPAGNNGTVKINDQTAVDDDGNHNEPQLDACDVYVRWYGFDEGERESTVTFTAQSPTAQGQLVSPTGAQDATFIAPARVDGNTLSNEEMYTLVFTGEPAEQGYKVKVTVYTDGSQGNDTKSKVFWMPASCGQEDDEEDEVNAPAPTFVDQTCEAKGTYTIPVGDVFTYKVAVGLGAAVEADAGTYEVTAPATITITAYFEGQAWTEDGSPWSHIFNVPKCDGDQPGSGGAPNPTTPASPVVTSGTAVSELPTTGPGDMGAFIALLAAAATYGAAYFAQPKRLYE